MTSRHQHRHRQPRRGSRNKPAPCRTADAGCITRDRAGRDGDDAIPHPDHTAATSPEQPPQRAQSGRPDDEQPQATAPSPDPALPHHDLAVLADDELVDLVRKKNLGAFGVLYRAHLPAAKNLARQLSRSPAEADDLVSEAFSKVLTALLAGNGPRTAFRAYLLTALRNTAYDKIRRDRKVELSGDVSTVFRVPAGAVSEEFDDTAVKGLERSLAAQAFSRLPERWQAVLWHTEIEDQPPAEVAPILGLSANAVSALAYRAREGLRQAYLQVHLAETTDRHCRAAAERLGSWTRGGLAKREKAQVEAHLDTCARCRALVAELDDVNGRMTTRCA